MKAAVYYKYGPPEVVSVRDVEPPTINEQEVLIRVHYSTLNRTDSGFRSAEYVISRLFSGLLKPKCNILGSEFSGEVIEIGKQVTKFKVGDRVFGYNDKNFGGHAELLKRHESDTFTKIPDNLSFEEAAPLTEGIHYALVDIRAAKVESGHKVLVYGATGAIGSGAVQLLKHFGAHVTAVCNTKNIELIKSLGADVVVDYTKQDYTQTDERYDFVFDAVGKSSFGASKKVLKPKGIYISTELGKNGENVWLSMLTPITGGKRLMFPLPTITLDDVNFIAELAANGKLKAVLDRTYTLDQIVEAYKYVETGQKTGNVLIKVK
jgi:NADPH:quinone reductase-like Zn-dependent oxidoreductase